MSIRNWFRFENKADDPKVADVYIYDEIGKSYWNDDAVGAAQFIAALSALPADVETIRVHINSPGGSVFDAHAMANALRSQRDDKGRTIEVRIDGLAASAATIVSSAGHPIRIADNAMMMIHEPSTIEMGNSAAFRKTADILDKLKASIVAVYRWVSKRTDEELSQMMADVTWMDAVEALEHGFATEIVAAGEPVTACFRPEVTARLGDVPERFRARVNDLLAPAETKAAPAPTDSGQSAPPVPAVASAADVLRLCREADCLDLAEGLVSANLTLEAVQAQLATVRADRQAAAARATEIRDLCTTARCPDLAEGYIALATSPAALPAVRDHLTRITAKLAAVEIDGHLGPDSGKPPAPRIDVVAVYADRNRLTKE